MPPTDTAAACGSDGGQAANPGEPDKVTVGVIPLLVLAAVVVANGGLRRARLDDAPSAPAGDIASVPLEVSPHTTAPNGERHRRRSGKDGGRR